MHRTGAGWLTCHMMSSRRNRKMSGRLELCSLETHWSVQVDD